MGSVRLRRYRRSARTLRVPSESPPTKGRECVEVHRALPRGSAADDLKHWRALFVASSELAGAKRGQYKKEWEQFAPIREYFSEDAPDGHAIARMATALDVVCHQVVSRVADPLTVHYELGQLLQSMHDWLSGIEGAEGRKTMLDSSYPSIARFFATYKPQHHGWPSRVYAFIE